MGELDDLTRQARLESEPTRREIREVLDGIEGVEILPHLRGVGGPSVDEIRRVRVAVHERRHDKAQGSWTFAGLGLGAVAAAAAAVFLLTPAPPVPLEMQLASAESTEVSLSEHVQLTTLGRGKVGGTTAAPRITWDNGLVDVSVTPKQGIDLQVTTREAHVRVVGTVFAVDRTALGTEVSVTRGRVETTCVGKEPVMLEGGDRVLCLPVDAAGWLGRARALRAAGSTTEDVVDAVATGLSSSGPEAVRGELLALRVRVLVDAGRRQDALKTAAQYLEEGHTPRKQAMSVLVRGGEQEVE